MRFLLASLFVAASLCSNQKPNTSSQQPPSSFNFDKYIVKSANKDANKPGDSVETQFTFSITPGNKSPEYRPLEEASKPSNYYTSSTKEPSYNVSGETGLKKHDLMDSGFGTQQQPFFGEPERKAPTGFGLTPNLQSTFEDISMTTSFKTGDTKFDTKFDKYPPQTKSVQGEKQLIPNSTKFDKIPLNAEVIPLEFEQVNTTSLQKKPYVPDRQRTISLENPPQESLSRPEEMQPVEAFVLFRPVKGSGIKLVEDVSRECNEACAFGCYVPASVLEEHHLALQPKYVSAEIAGVVVKFVVIGTYDDASVKPKPKSSAPLFLVSDNFFESDLAKEQADLLNSSLLRISVVFEDENAFFWGPYEGEEEDVDALYFASVPDTEQFQGVSFVDIKFMMKTTMYRIVVEILKHHEKEDDRIRLSGSIFNAEEEGVLNVLANEVVSVRLLDYKDSHREDNVMTVRVKKGERIQIVERK